MGFSTCHYYIDIKGRLQIPPACLPWPDDLGGADGIPLSNVCTHQHFQARQSPVLP
jgi:hypothetical protein